MGFTLREEGLSVVNHQNEILGNETINYSHKFCHDSFSTLRHSSSLNITNEDEQKIQLKRSSIFLSLERNIHKIGSISLLFAKFTFNH